MNSYVEHSHPLIARLTTSNVETLPMIVANNVADGGIVHVVVSRV